MLRRRRRRRPTLVRPAKTSLQQPLTPLGLSSRKKIDSVTKRWSRGTVAYGTVSETSSPHETFRSGSGPSCVRPEVSWTLVSSLLEWLCCCPSFSQKKSAPNDGRVEERERLCHDHFSFFLRGLTLKRWGLIATHLIDSIAVRFCCYGAEKQVSFLDAMAAFRGRWHSCIYRDFQCKLYMRAGIV